MPIDDFFPQRPAATPTIYAFASTHPDHAGLLKVGYTERVAAAEFETHERHKWDLMRQLFASPKGD